MKTDIETLPTNAHFQNVTAKNQSNYITHECGLRNIPAIFYAGRIFLASPAHLSNFKKVVSDSYGYLLKDRTNPSLPAIPNFLKKFEYYNKNRLIGIVFKDQNICHALVKEKTYKEFLYFVYKNKIPQPSYILIFNTEKEINDLVEAGFEPDFTC